MAGGHAVDRQRRLLGLLGAVDVGPGGAVDHHVGPLELELGVNRRLVGDVEFGVAEADYVVAGVAGGEDDVAPEHSGRACDENLHLVSNDLHCEVLRPSDDLDL